MGSPYISSSVKGILKIVDGFLSGGTKQSSPLDAMNSIYYQLHNKCTFKPLELDFTFTS